MTTERRIETLLSDNPAQLPANSEQQMPGTYRSSLEHSNPISPQDATGLSYETEESHDCGSQPTEV